MQYQMMKSKSGWSVLVTRGTEVIVEKKFMNRGAAETWRRKSVKARQTADDLRPANKGK